MLTFEFGILECVCVILIFQTIPVNSAKPTKTFNQIEDHKKCVRLTVTQDRLRSLS